MHLLPSYGSPVDEIIEEGFEVSDEIYMALDGHNHFTMAKSLGIFLTSFVDVLKRIKPDWLILAGDRGEQLMGAIAAGYTYIPVAHIQAGELSGNIDGQARHAIGKFVHLHFASNNEAGQRLLKLGEEPFRVHVVGAPQLDELVGGMFAQKKELENKYDISLDEPFFMVVQHPVTEEYDQADDQIKSTITALNQIDMKKIWILPNNDAGNDIIRKRILQDRVEGTIVFRNLKRQDYLGLLKLSACIVGNSSSGLIEAPTFQVPCINIGRRQAGRFCSSNVINVSHFDVEAIIEAINKATLPEFINSFKDKVNPYGDGGSSNKILNILENTPKDSHLLIKRLTY